MATKKQLTPEDADAAIDYFGDEVFDSYEAERRAGTWQPGQSGNPRGRPVEPDNLTDVLIWRLGKSGRRKLADTLIGLAVDKKDLEAIKYIYDRIEGKPRQAVQQTITEEPRIVGILRSLVDDETALEGRELTAIPATFTSTEEKVRESFSA